MPRTVMLVALVLLIAAASSGGASAQIIDPAVHNLERLTISPSRRSWRPPSSAQSVSARSKSATSRSKRRPATRSSSSAVRPGTFEFGPKGMMERGTIGKFVVESATGG